MNDLPERRVAPPRRENDAMAAAVAQGVLVAFHTIMQDEKLMSDFWGKGFDQLTQHAGTNASQWIGKRILLMAIAAIFSWSMLWLYRAGAFK